MKTTVAGLVTPHLLRIVELANNAQNGAKVDWHVRDAVAKTMGELGRQANASALVDAYVEGLDYAVAHAPKARTDYTGVLHAAYTGVLQAAADEARRLRRD